MATESSTPIEEIIRTVGDGLAERGWGVRHIESSPLSGRLIATEPATGEEWEVDVLEETFWASLTVTEYGPVLALDDVIGTKGCALADRGAVRDLIDVHADLASLHRRPGKPRPSPRPLRVQLPRPARIASLARSGGMTRTSPTTACVLNK